MQGRMAPLKKSQNSTKLPLALNPTKSKDVLAVLAERNQAVIPVGVWVEPASPNSLEIPASTSAHMIEEELKEQLRKKQEALKHFQRQVKHRVNQQIRLKKQQQLQKSFEAAEKEGSIAMQSSDPAHFTPKGTSIFPSNLNAAVGSSGLPASQMFGSAIKDGENQNELFQQQAQALSQTMKQVRHRLASHKTVSKKKSSLFPDGMRKSFSTQQESDSEEVLSIITNEKGRDDLFWGDKQSLFSEDNDKPFSRVQEKYIWQPSLALTVERWKKEWPTRTEPYLSHRFQGQPSTGDQSEQKEEEDQQEKVHFLEPFSDEEGREDFSLVGYQCLPPQTQFQDLIREQHSNYGQASHDMTDEKWRRELLPEYHRYGLHKIQDPGSARDQSLYFRQQPSVGTAERCQEDLLLNHHQHLLPKHQRDTCSRRQVYNDYQSGLNNEFQTPLAFQSGVDKEEDKKERQKQYLRHRRLFMDIEREQVKEQKRQKEQKKKIEKIKKKKEQQRYAEEQKIVRMNFNEEPCSGEKMSGMLAQLQLEELKETREKQQQREKEHIRYVEALRAQVQEKMQLYNITLPPLCCCGPNFWDAHPDTCANNCIFYKNHRAYHRALHSVISSSDISEGNSTLRSAIHNFASAHRRALKNL
ncbi:coiled-coil domain-containing protein 15 isoform X16 [Marmota marmota marmota]|uniref:coiled-coil domain-containing protein 15 isoform X16 n=1 Tax=Marmota marmota marmota TaxID=9994 RepID=UPI00209305F0|nr:coiled-coil domain-containing protein 15 isoform X16 [Marmota marmota marmota]